MKRWQQWIPGGGLLCSSRAWAHDGHGSGVGTIWHYLLEPIHLAAIVAVIAGIAAMLWLLRRLRRQHGALE
jgi:hypothetical protein